MYKQTTTKKKNENMISHTHEYAFWHIHLHNHAYRELPKEAFEGHDTGHYHLWSQTHSHGEGIKMPHTHKDKQVHPDESFVHHHAIVDHEPPDEHHPECKPPYYGGGLNGCIDRCEAKKKKEPCGEICFHTCGRKPKNNVDD